MFNKSSYEQITAERDSLRRQLKETYEKCTSIYETLAFVDEHCRKERNILEELIVNLRRTIDDEWKENRRLTDEKFLLEKNHRSLRFQFENQRKDVDGLQRKLFRLHLIDQQEKYIQENRFLPIPIPKKK